MNNKFWVGVVVEETLLKKLGEFSYTKQGDNPEV